MGAVLAVRDGAGGMAHGLGELTAELPVTEAIEACGRVSADSPLRMDERLQACVDDNEALIRHDADASGIDRSEFERQLKLHLLTVGLEILREGRHREAYEMVRHTALERALGIHLHQQKVASEARMKLLRDAEYGCKRGLSLETRSGTRLPLRFGRVMPSIGNHYQANLHYLQAVRGDTSLHYGMFLPDAEMPMAYIALSACDRPYMTEALAVSGYQMEDFLVLTRMYGLPGLPSNLMSMMTKHLIGAIRQSSRARVLLTAYNPLLGFRGAAYRASGFRSFAVAPVGYGYNGRGEYTTRRLGDGVQLSDLSTPPNVLMARGMDRITQFVLDRPCELVRISDEAYWGNTTTHAAL